MGQTAPTEPAIHKGGVSVKVIAQEDDEVAYSTSGLTTTSPKITKSVHMSALPPAPTLTAGTSVLSSPDVTSTPTQGPITMSSHSWLRIITDPSGLAILAEAAAAAAATTSRLERSQTTPTEQSISLPNSNRDSGLSPDEITIIVAVVISVVVFLLLLAIAIRCAILQRCKHVARERARRTQARPPMSRLPPALEKPPESSLHGSVAASGGHLAEDEPNLKDDDTGFRVVIRPPPGYRTPQSGPTTPIDSHHYPPGSRPASAQTFGMPAAGGPAPNEGGHHWSLDTENGSVLSGSTREIILNRLSITTTESK
ncbi:uncharacterized protein PG986_002609 [Apiospora aurea]|uniref:Uncharacterized protein n=1 Tax=Apiospora aurea TaxID=335848 RepID=A0ABR1QPW8_9PEZI